MTDAARTADEELLASLGYKQEFRREFTGLEVSVYPQCPPVRIYRVWFCAERAAGHAVVVVRGCRNLRAQCWPRRAGEN